MDGRGGCCIARYDAGNSYDLSKMNRIMLRFRPIAPKPVLNGKDSVSSTAESSDVYVKTGRGKRRYARNNSNTDSNNGSGTKRSNTRRKKKSPSSSSEDNDKTVVSSGSFSRGDAVAVTLPLLPETPEEMSSLAIKGSSPISGSGGDRKVDRKGSLPMWLSFGKEDKVRQEDEQRRSVYVPVSTVVGTWVRVEECIAEVWLDLFCLGRTDEEKLINLEKDTCPGFLSDGFNRVQWTNKAYRDMTAAQGGEGVVWLVIKEGTKLPVRSPAFTCSVRLVTSGKEKNSLILPCDVWRLDCGGLAWRLDTKAALSLGR